MPKLFTTKTLSKNLKIDIFNNSDTYELGLRLQLLRKVYLGASQISNGGFCKSI